MSLNLRSGSTLLLCIVPIGIAIGAELKFGNVIIDSSSAGLTPLARILIVVAVLGSVLELIMRFVESLINKHYGSVRPDGTTREIADRFLNILPLVKGVLGIIIVACVGMMTLSELGVNITPLLGGAGILGLTIGLGMQSLFKDIAAGAFFIAEDAFRVGETVEMTGVSGLVEKVSIRSAQIRDWDGGLQTVPYSQIDKVNNQSREWRRYTIEFGVGHDTDINMVEIIIDDIVSELVASESFRSMIIEPPKLVGISDVNHFGPILQIRFKTRADADGFGLRRNFIRQLRQAFDDCGIRFARRSVRVEGGSSVSDAVADDANNLEDRLTA